MNPVPDVLRVPHARGELVLRHAPELCALAEDPASERAAASGAETVLQLGDYRIVRDPNATDSKLRGLPVYRDPSGALCVATGRVWVRLTEGVELSKRASELESRGFTIESVAGHAPHAGWVVHPGGVGDALRHYTELGSVTDCELFEPQLLRSSARRSS